MATKRPILFTLLSLAALAALIWLVLPARESEPVYQGKSLRYWLARHSSDFADEQATEAIRQIGTNAMPTLLEMLQEKDSPFKLKWIALMQKQHLFKTPQTATIRNYQACWGFQVLGPAASNAVPALLQIYRDKISFTSQYAIVDALGDIGPSALPQATPILLEGLTNSNVSLRLYAAVAIGQIHGQPDVFVPALINALKDYPLGRRFACNALADYGPAAKPAVPALVALLNDLDSSIRAQATNALKKIDPEAAANAGVK